MLSNGGGTQNFLPPKSHTDGKHWAQIDHSNLKSLILTQGLCQVGCVSSSVGELVNFATNQFQKRSMWIMGTEYSDNIQVLSFWLTEELIWANEVKAAKRYELISKKYTSELTKEAWIRPVTNMFHWWNWGTFTNWNTFKRKQRRLWKESHKPQSCLGERGLVTLEK